MPWVVSTRVTCSSVQRPPLGVRTRFLLRSWAMAKAVRPAAASLRSAASKAGDGAGSSADRAQGRCRCGPISSVPYSWKYTFQ